MSETVAKLQLKNLRDNPRFVQDQQTIVELMKSSGLHDFLRSVARCQIYDGGANPARSAAEAQANAGYHNCLDDIMYFAERFLTESAVNKKVPMDFGGRRLALAKGDLLEGDIK